jgi:hypothetical protein
MARPRTLATPFCSIYVLYLFEASENLTPPERRFLPGAAGAAAMSPTVSRLMQASHDR